MAVNAMIERAARAVATARLARELGFPAEADIVQTAINARWREYEADAREAIASLADPDATALEVIKPVKSRPEAKEHFNAVIAGIVG